MGMKYIFAAEMNLSLLSQFLEIWDIICWQTSGNGVTCLSMCSKQLRSSTRQSPAFVFLAGRDIDGFLVPWNDRSNVLKPSALYKGWNPDYHYRLRASAYATCLDRQTSAIIAVDKFVRDVEDGVFFDDDEMYVGCVRPCTPVNTPVNILAQNAKCICRCEGNKPLIPAVFPVEAHAHEAANLARRLSSDPNDTTSSDDVDDDRSATSSSSHDDNL